MRLQSLASDEDGSCATSGPSAKAPRLLLVSQPGWTTLPKTHIAPWKWTLPKGKSSFNYHFSGSILVCREGIGGIGAFAVGFCFPLEFWFGGLVFAFEPHHLEVCWGGIKSASRLASVCLKSATELDFYYMPFFKTTHELLISKHLFETRCCFPAIFVAIRTLPATHILVAKS